MTLIEKMPTLKDKIYTEKPVEVPEVEKEVKEEVKVKKIIKK